MDVISSLRGISSRLLASWRHALLIVTALGLGVAASQFIPRPRIPRATNESRQVKARQALVQHGGDELVLIYVGSSNCAFSVRASLHEALQQFSRRVAERAEAQGLAFRSVGVTTDWDINEGWKHLRTVMAFDEVVVGMNWINTGLIRYLWEDLPGPPATPQVLLTRRTIVSPPSADSVAGYHIANERVIARFVGLDKIISGTARPIPME